MGLWSDLFPAQDYPGVTSVPTTFSELALGQDVWKLPIVVATRSLIADTVGSFTIDAVYPDGTKVEPNRTLLKRPSPREPLGDTLERTVNSMTRHGIAWYRITLEGSDGYPSALEFIDATRVNYQTDDWNTRFTAIEIDGVRQDPRQIRYVPMTLDGGVVPKSPLVEIRETLEHLQEAYNFSNQYYSFTGAVPPFAIKSGVKLNAGQAEKLAVAWADARDKRRPAILSGDLDIETYKPTSAADALVLDAITHLSADVARVMHVPPSLANTQSLTSLTYSTTTDEFRRWAATGLAPYLSRIESVFTDMLPSTMVAKFDTSNLTRMEEAGRAKLNIDYLNAGIYTVDEIRASLALEPLPNAERPADVDA